MQMPFDMTDALIVEKIEKWFMMKVNTRPQQTDWKAETASKLKQNLEAIQEIKGQVKNHLASTEAEHNHLDQSSLIQWQNLSSVNNTGVGFGTESKLATADRKVVRAVEHSALLESLAKKRVARVHRGTQTGNTIRKKEKSIQVNRKEKTESYQQTQNQRTLSEADQ